MTRVRVVFATAFLFAALAAGPALAQAEPPPLPLPPEAQPVVDALTPVIDPVCAALLPLLGPLLPLCVVAPPPPVVPPPNPEPDTPPPTEAPVVDSGVGDLAPLEQLGLPPLPVELASALPESARQAGQSSLAPALSQAGTGFAYPVVFALPLLLLVLGAYLGRTLTRSVAPPQR